MKPKATGLTHTSRVRTAKRRARIYGILAAIYAGPVDEAFLSSLRGLKIPGDTFLPVQNERLSGGLSQLRRWLEDNAALPGSAVFAQLSPEFTRLFRGVNRRSSPLPPYESVYREGRLFGDSTGKITEMFRRYSLAPHSNEPPDHISVELDFMRFLCLSEAETSDSGNSREQALREEEKFLEEHLLRWVPSLCEQVRKFDGTGFYKGLADITEGWISYDRTVIEGLIRDK